MMHKNLFTMVLAALAVLGLGIAASGDDYTIDTAHSGVVFKISHSDLNWVYGRFNQFSGDFVIDPSDPSKSSFTMTIKPESVDTNNAKRDGHLRSPDFFNSRQFPAMKFTSTSVKPIEGGLEVTGDLTMHGETKPVTFNLMGGKTAATKGGQRTGYTAEFKLKALRFRNNQVFADAGRRGSGSTSAFRASRSADPLRYLNLASGAPAWVNGKRWTPITDAGMAHLDLPNLRASCWTGARSPTPASSHCQTCEP